MGLEISKEKTKVVNFRKYDFDFIGFTFHHWESRKKDNKPAFYVTPKKESIKDFRLKIKEKTRKTLTLNNKEWINRVNPIIRGKVNYYVTIIKAIKANEEVGQKSRCTTRWMRRFFLAIYGYIRRRLRVAFIHRHPNQKKEQKMRIKLNNTFFVVIKLTPSYWLYLNQAYCFRLEEYINEMKIKGKKKYHNAIKRAKERCEEYFIPHRPQKMQNAWKAS
ncbi:hypothetical protein [Neobacillus vireti]|uniref:hypothetical protein n=1 Tax=Neobacillus vireti TaxID=220686 RepID=UPI002FFDB9F9